MFTVTVLGCSSDSISILKRMCSSGSLIETVLKPERFISAVALVFSPALPFNFKADVWRTLGTLAPVGGCTLGLVFGSSFGTFLLKSC